MNCQFKNVVCVKFFSMFRLLQCKLCSNGSGRVYSIDATEHRCQHPCAERQHLCWSTLLGHSYKWTLLFSWLHLACWLHLLWSCMSDIVFVICKLNIFYFTYFILGFECTCELLTCALVSCQAHLLAWDVIYTSHTYATMSVSVCLWRKCIVVTVHARKRGGVILHYASHY